MLEEVCSSLFNPGGQPRTYKALIFDYTKGFKFSNLCNLVDRQAITRAIADQALTIRIPVLHG